MTPEALQLLTTALWWQFPWLVLILRTLIALSTFLFLGAVLLFHRSQIFCSIAKTPHVVTVSGDMQVWAGTSGPCRREIQWPVGDQPEKAVCAQGDKLHGHAEADNREVAAQEEADRGHDLLIINSSAPFPSRWFLNRQLDVWSLLSVYSVVFHVS